MFPPQEFDIFWASVIITSTVPIAIPGVLALLAKGPEKLSSYESDLVPGETLG